LPFAAVRPYSRDALGSSAGDGSLRFRAALAFMVGLTLAAGARAADASACHNEAIGTATARAVLDGRTVALADGRELRLAGIEAPRRDDAAGRAATAALHDLLAGRTLGLRRLGGELDRYGRLVALLAIEPGSASGRERSAQAELLAQGHARVAARVGDMRCAAEFLRIEENARTAGLGLWSDPAYPIRTAGNTGDILAERGRFTVVEGKVLSVRESGGTIYVNFGRRWSEDFTVTVLKRNERRFSAAGQVLKELAGRRVRVRGTVEERGGPWIEALHPEQIEITERN
jgi:endonuclease YncB( thermonuclease family)